MLGELRSKEKVQGSGQGEVVEQMAQGQAVGNKMGAEESAPGYGVWPHVASSGDSTHLYAPQRNEGARKGELYAGALLPAGW